ncbi:DNA/RNA non-specific endonuclease [Noviherbaspirillum malthae]|jgi:endonuclease G|uniref:DNA/RNA non-specific endonuclease n=1 Tax=Noviherbaspirillum malthae TaxID=1260987 RepID=UPI001890661B|nr:DNA/RNA non-specific endonuclease [Noviherbaspirillum malthae]
MKKFILTLVLLASTSAHARETASSNTTPKFRDCPQFFAGATSPRINKSFQVAPRALCYQSFAILYSGVSKTPVFVAERLNRAQLEDAKDEKRTNRFFADARLRKTERAELDDYKGSGFDRGHMAPAGDMPSARAMAQSFSLANVVPQAPKNNQKAWSGIEQATRKYVMRAKGDVYVISGPVYEGKPKTIGRNRIWVPRYLYKLVYDPATGRAWAHWIENTDQARASKPISYEELVRKTNIEFLPKSKVIG